jgi:carbamoyltransferase
VDPAPEETFQQRPLDDGLTGVGEEVPDLERVENPQRVRRDGRAFRTGPASANLTAKRWRLDRGPAITGRGEERDGTMANLRPRTGGDSTTGWLSRWRGTKRRRPFGSVDAERVVGLACTGHGASLVYVDRAGTIVGSQLERWTGVKHMLLFSADESEAFLDPQNDIDRSINYTFTDGYGRYPDALVFENTIEPWFEWLLRDLDVKRTDIDLLVTSSGFFVTGPFRLGGQLDQWFPSAVIECRPEHHQVHQRQAFWASGFSEAAVLTLDTCGEGLQRLGGRHLCGTISVMTSDGDIETIREFLFPEMSSGAIYDATTHHVGFRTGDEGKTMGLAPYGQPELLDELSRHLALHDDGGFTFVSRRELEERFTAYVPARAPGAELTQRHMDVAFAGQGILERIVANAWRAALALTGQSNLAYAGGVALNSVANERAVMEVRPQGLYIAPNPGDPGQGLGCALLGAYEIARWDPPAVELGEYLGPDYSEAELATAVGAAPYEIQRDVDERVVATCIANGFIVARFAGQAEFGPRALGNRSIICDARRPGMKDFLNSRVKHRESFRPFAPTVLEEWAGEWFELVGASSYMLRVGAVRADKCDRVPAIVHVDGTARIQTLRRDQNPAYWRLVTAFHELTGVPVVLNTSFNVAKRPIVETPEHALECFVSTEIDVLLLGPFVVSKRPLADYLAEDSGA